MPTKSNKRARAHSTPANRRSSPRQPRPAGRGGLVKRINRWEHEEAEM